MVWNLWPGGCPCHEDHTPSLSIKDGERGLLLFCFAGSSFPDVRADLRRRGQIDGNFTTPKHLTRPPNPPAQVDDRARTAFALDIWRASTPIRGMLGWKYFTERRGLRIGALGDLSHCLRWNQRIGAVVGLMTDPLTNNPTGIHRTYIAPDATKLDRRMLGRQGSLTAV